MNYLENPYDPEYMKASKLDTQAFKNGIRMTRSNKFELEEMQESKLMEGMFSTPALMGGALLWLIVAAIFLHGSKPWHQYVTYTLLIMAGGMITVWFLVHAVKPAISFLKPFAVKVIDFICKPVL